MTAQTTCPEPTRLRGLLDGALSDEDQAALTGHLETCPRCQEALESLVAGRESWEGAAARLRDADAGDATRTGPTVADADLPPGFLGPPEEPGQLGTLAQYQILEVVGRGGMSVVFKAFDGRLRRVVAVKVMAPQLAANAAARRRFDREARAAAAVSHEHVVAIHDVNEAGGLPYLVMHYVAGPSLQERIDRNGPLELAEILRIGMQTAEGLAAAHKQGLVHRDVKPANILLENGVERVLLTDFGLARAADDAALTQSGVVAGTPQYMAPEQAAGEAVDHRADLFSLGSVLYAMCTGRPPFRATNVMAVLKRVCEESPRPVREVNPDVPEWLAAIIAKLHAKKPTDRFQSAAEIADLLGRHLAHLQQPTQAPIPAPVAAPLAPLPASRRSWTPQERMALATILIAAGTLLTVFAWLPGEMSIWITLLCFAVPAISIFAAITMFLSLKTRRLRRMAAQTPSLKAPQIQRPAARRGRRLTALAILLPIAAGIGVVAVVLWKQAATRPRPVDDAWVEAVAAMPNDRQAPAVRDKMRELNPGFSGRMNLTVTEDAAITYVVFSTENVADISPLRALRRLHSLECPGTSPVIRGKLADLSPLRGLPLTRLVIHNTEVKDLSPLQDMPLTYLSCYATNVEDLAPLRGMPLTHLDAGSTHVSDLSPLGGMKLTFLHCDHTGVGDLRPLSGMPLEELHCHETRVADLSPLWALPLTTLRCKYVSGRDDAVVRSLANLHEFNERPLEVWMKEHQKPFVARAGTGDKILLEVDRLEEVWGSKLSELDAVRIEVRGDGPFVVPPLDFKEQAVAIRAAEGCRPVFVLSDAGVAEGAPLIQTHGPLTLEGLELRQDGARKADPPGGIGYSEERHALVAASMPHVREPVICIANCRFRMDPAEARACLYVADVPSCSVRNCEFINRSGAGIVFRGNLYDTREVSVKDCLFACSSGLRLPYLPNAVIRYDVSLESNTFVGSSFIHLVYKSFEDEGGGDTKIFNLTGRGNVLGGRFTFSQSQGDFFEKDLLSAESAEGFIRRRVSWVESGNLYSAGAEGDFLPLRIGGNEVPPTQKRKSLKDWKEFWGSKDVTSVEGVARFKGGDLRARMGSEPQKLTPDDFRLLPDSPGRGKDGKPDCGANVDLVGPGAAYERWKKTPEYKLWLKAKGLP
jgi:serine/threonine protein kinase